MFCYFEYLPIEPIVPIEPEQPVVPIEPTVPEEPIGLATTVRPEDATYMVHRFNQIKKSTK